MWKKRIVCLALVICAALVMTACQQKETFPTAPQAPAEQPTAEPQSDQNIFGDTPVPQEIDFDDGSYDPTQEEGGGEEEVIASVDFNLEAPTEAPTMQSEYAGATPVLIDPIDKPTPTPLPPLTFSYQKYTASALHLTFEGPVGWVEDDSMPDTYILTNPTAGVDYAAQLSIQLVPVDKARNKNELIKEVKTRLDEIGGTCLKYERSQTAGRKFMNVDGVYANYKATTLDGAKIAGRMIISCVNKTLYILHVSYPQGYTGDYVDKVYDKFRHTVKIIDTTAAAATKTN